MSQFYAPTPEQDGHSSSSPSKWLTSSTSSSRTIPSCIPARRPPAAARRRQGVVDRRRGAAEGARWPWDLPARAAPRVGLGRISTGLGCPHAETNPDFLGLMAAFRTGDGRRVDFITINHGGAPTDTPEEFIALLKATADAAGGDHSSNLLTQARLLGGLVRHAGARAPAIATQVIRQTSRTTRSSSAYQPVLDRRGPRARGARQVHVRAPPRGQRAAPRVGRRGLLSVDWRARQGANALEFRLYWIPFLDERDTPLKDLTREWKEQHKVPVGTVTFPATAADSVEARLQAMLASEMGANQGNWVEDDRGTSASGLPATEFTAARFLAYRVSQRPATRCPTRPMRRSSARERLVRRLPRSSCAAISRSAPPATTYRTSARSRCRERRKNETEATDSAGDRGLPGRGWYRQATRQIETAFEAERFIEQVGFGGCLSDSRRPGPSLYVAVCGRRDAVMPRHVQKDPEASLTWKLKDELVRRGKVYYGKLARGKSTFIAPRLVPYFHAVWGVRRSEEQQHLSRNARSVLKVLRREWEMSTADLRDESGVRDRTAFIRALDELQAAMIVVPSGVFYLPKLTYIWTLGCWTLSGTAASAGQSRNRLARDRPLLSGRRRHDDSRRTGACDRPVAAGRRTGQPRARGRRPCDHARAGHVSIGLADDIARFRYRERMRNCTSCASLHGFT